MINQININKKIGVFYKDEWWKNEVRDSLVCTLNIEDIAKITKDMIFLKNGDYIRFIDANSQSRGCRFDKIYYQKGISDEIIRCVITPHLLSPIQMIVPTN